MCATRHEIEVDACSDKQKRSKKARERLDILPSCRDLQNFRYMLTEANQAEFRQ